jgi:rubrerythrin
MKRKFGGYRMSIEFKNSETRQNLMRAFAGESQARNRYTFGASQAKGQKLHVIESIFTFTANQEKEHAEIFYKHLAEAAGETIKIDGGYPVDITQSIVELLRHAQHNEYEEYDPVYKSFGDKAIEEGFPQIASSFHKIAEIEKTHGDRFGKFADLLEQNKLFVSDVECGWMCLNCGYVYTGKEVPAICPVCQHDRGYFIRLEMAPFEAQSRFHRL